MKQEALRNKQHQVELQQALKSDLEKQMEDKKLRRQLEKDEDNKYFDVLTRDTAQRKADESAKSKAMHDKVAFERAQQMEQIQMNRQRKENEKLRRKQEATDIMKLV